MHADFHRFAHLLIELPPRFTADRSGDSLSLEEFIERAKIHWHKVHLWAPNLSVDSHSLAATGYVENEGGFH
jgi:hypothetical protein